MMIPIYKIITGFGVGLTYGIAGYISRADENKDGIISAEEFDINKLAPALIEGVVVGILAELAGINITTMVGYFAALGGTLLIDRFWKTLRRRF